MTTTRPTRVAQTSTEVKKLYKQNGPGFTTERQQRQLQRAADLEKRALGIREREERGKANKKKREAKERKEATLRRMTGVGLATQLIGYSHTQAQLKKGMEAFLGYKRKSDQDRKEKELEVAKQLEAAVEEAAREPWDDDADDTFDLPEPSARVGDQFLDDDLDDDSLLEIHDQVMSDPVEETTEAPQPPQVASSAPVRHSPNMLQSSKEDIEFVRIHGPINKIIDSILDKLPVPLIELLSLDCSIDATAWNPSPALLHKLNPPGLPPHRLRVKVGCVVTVLRDLNTSSQLSRSQHLQILRVEQDRLECLVLDGQLEGTKTILTKISFTAKHRNEDMFPFQRIQFPIQVSKDFIAPTHSRQTSLSGFKKPMPSSHTSQPSNYSSKRMVPPPRAIAQTNRNPSFKLPGLPASKSEHAPNSKPILSPPTPNLDCWEDFLDSATQIARDLSYGPSRPCKATLQTFSDPKTPVVHAAMVTNSLPPLSTQDFDFSLEDLEDFPILSQDELKDRDEQSRQSVNPPPLPGIPPSAWPQPSKLPKLATAPPEETAAPVLKLDKQSTLKRKYSEDSAKATESAAPTTKALAATGRRGSAHLFKKLRMQSAMTTTGSNTAITEAGRDMGAKRRTSKPQEISRPSFSQFGLSTQEAVSFFDEIDDDDDDLAFGSPPIAVQ